jgi:hypothetical protein
MAIHLPFKPLQAHIPDDLTVPQFIFESQHELRPPRQQHIPWLIEDETGRGIGGDEVDACLLPFFQR